MSWRKPTLVDLLSLAIHGDLGPKYQVRSSNHLTFWLLSSSVYQFLGVHSNSPSVISKTRDVANPCIIAILVGLDYVLHFLVDLHLSLAILGHVGPRYQVRSSCVLTTFSSFPLTCPLSHTNGSPVVSEMRDMADLSMFAFLGDLNYVFHSSLLSNPGVALFVT